MKNARRKLEILMPAAMPCKTPINSGGETYCGIEKTRQNMLVLSTDESTRFRLEGALYRYHEDHIAAKGINSLSHYSLGAQVYSNASSIKSTRCEGCSGKRLGKIGRDTCMAANESQKQKRGER